MFCPNCGANNTTEQKFCRSCGLNLEQTAASLLLQIPSAQSANLMRREKLIEKFGKFALGGLGIIGVIAVIAGIYVLIARIIATGTDIFTTILLIGFIVFALLSLIFVFFNESLKEKKANFNSELKKNLIEKDTGKLLEDRTFAPISSVTENSTDLLKSRNRTKKFE